MCQITLSKSTKKATKKWELTGFFGERLRDFSHYSHYCKQKKMLSTLGNSNLTHFTTDVIFSGQRFAILAMFVESMRDVLCEEVA